MEITMASIQTKKSFLIYLGIALAVVILGNLISRNWFFRLDLTDSKMYSLSPSSKAVVSKIDDLLTAKVYYSENLPGEYGNSRRYLQDILEEYAAYSGGNFRFEFYEPANDAQLEEDAQKYGIQPVQLQVIENDRQEIKRVHMGMVLLYEDRREVLPVIQSTAGLEYTITTKIKKMVDDSRQVVGIAEFPDSPAKFQNLRSILAEGYEVRSVNLEENVPTDVDLLIMGGITDSVTGPELVSLMSYIWRGGSFLLAQNSVQVDLQTQRGSLIQSNIFEILKPFGLTLEKNLVLDKVSGYVQVLERRGPFQIPSAHPYPFFPVIRNFSDHLAVEGLEEISLIFTSEISYEPDKQNIQPLFYTSNQSFEVSQFINLSPLKNPVFESLNQPAKVVGVFATAQPDSANPATAQMMLIADNDFLSDGGGGNRPENAIFVLNAIDVMNGKEELVALRSREITTRPLQVIDAGSRTTWKTINILLPALLVLAFGLAQWRLESNRTRRLEEIYG